MTCNCPQNMNPSYRCPHQEQQRACEAWSPMTLMFLLHDTYNIIIYDERTRDKSIPPDRRLENRKNLVEVIKQLQESTAYWREQYHMLRGTWDGIFDHHEALTWPPPDHISKAGAGRKRHFALVKTLEDWVITSPERRDPAMLEQAIRVFLYEQGAE